MTTTKRYPTIAFLTVLMTGCGSPADSDPDNGTDIDLGSPCAAGEFHQNGVCLPPGVYVRGTSPNAGMEFDDWHGGGTPSAPAATLAEGLLIAQRDGHTSIYLCGTYTGDGTFNPQHTADIDGLEQPLTISGEFVCNASHSWERQDARASLAVTIQDTTAALTLTRLRLVSTTAVAVLIEDSTDVTLDQCEVRAGLGETSTPATAWYEFPFVPEFWGPTGCSVACPNGTDTAGGTGGAVGVAGTPGLPALGVPDYKRGFNGTNGALGAGAAIWGRVVDGVWVGEPGLYGVAGGTGQGGSGGTAWMADPAAGGACGGCGGAGGRAGNAGASSIGVLSIRSGVTITGGNILTVDATPGANGLVGQQGQLGALPFIPSGGGGVDLRVGGQGGDGAEGGGGGGGAGGISVAVLYQGTIPTLDASVETAFGQAGGGGVGSTPLTNDGIDGVSGRLVELPAPVPHCTGVAESCAEATDLTMCARVPGCRADRSCTLRPGFSGDCNFVYQETCEGYPRCQWGSCLGTPHLCSALQQADCDAVPGCDFAP